MDKDGNSTLETSCFPEETLDAIKEEMQVADGELPGDLLIRNIQIVDVYSGQIFPGSLLIKNGKIVSMDPGDQFPATTVFDGEGLFACPGFIDPHYHIDTTFVTPDVLAGGIVPAGTTTVCAEILDFTHHEWKLGGEEAAIESVRLFLKDHHRLPYRLLPMAPGKMIPTSITTKLLNLDGFFGLGEILPGFILNMDEAYLSILMLAKRLNKWTTGHIIGFAWVKQGDRYVSKMISKEEINRFALAGFTSDHEAWKYESALQLLQHGVKPLVRGMFEQYKAILSEMLKNNISVDDLLFCYDDISFDTVMRFGHMNRMVGEAINLGMDPIKAIRAATLNVAREIGLERKLGSLTPGKLADLILFEDFHALKPSYVFKGGELVAENGKLVRETRLDYSPLTREMPRYCENLRLEDLEYPATAETLSSDRQTAQAKLMDIFAFRVDEVPMPVQDGEIQPCISEDKLKLVLAARDESHSLIKAFVHGFHLQEGAIAISFTQNAHRIIAVGVTDQEILTALQAVDQHAGALAVIRNRVPVEVLPLEISGMMSGLPLNQVKARMEHITQLMCEMGCDLAEPILLLWTCGFMFRFQ